MQKKYFSFITVLLTIFVSLPTTPVFAQKAAPVLKLSDPLPANLFVELARVVNPAVVNISTKVRPRQMLGNRDPFFEMLEQMYGLKSMPQQQQQPSAPRPHSLGTGFIIRDDGLIVTNNHVITGADEVEVQIDEKSDKLYKATIVGSDERTDIALIKIEGKNFPTLSLGSSNDTQVGEWVAAFGNPFGQGHSMTKGIVSAKGRALSEINRFPLIQTDAPINPGNSGGPLVNSRGQVIGVNAAIDPRAQGIGFAIPIDEVKNLLPQLEKLGRLRRGYLGIQLADLDPQAAMALGLKDLQGAVVARVEKGTPASKAGILPYDVITEFNSTKIHDSAELRNVIADTSIGSKVPVKIVREGKNKSLDVVIGEFSERPQKNTAFDVKKNPGNKAPFELGFSVLDSSAQIRREFDLEEDVTKPVIVEVTPESPAAGAGVLPGDVVLDVNRKEVTNASEVTKAFKKGTNTMRVVRQQAVIFVMLEVP
jgi:serine protease Do